MNIINVVIEQCVKYCTDVEAIYLFGSRAKGNFRADSDLDIAVLCLHAVSGETRWNLSQSLAIALKTEVDVIDLKQASTVMQWQIISTGKRIFTNNVTQSAFFETYIFSDYIRLNEQRQGILNDIQQRGYVYGD